MNPLTKTTLSALALAALLASVPMTSAEVASDQKANIADLAEAAALDGCNKEEPPVDCAVRVTYEFAWTLVGPYYTAVRDYCNDLSSACPLYLSVDALAVGANAQYAQIGCNEGEEVVDCAVRIASDYVLDVVFEALARTIELCRDLTSSCPLIKAEDIAFSTAASSNTVDLLEIIEKAGGCREGEEVIDCLTRITLDYALDVVFFVLARTIELCNDLSSACPLILVPAIVGGVKVNAA